MPRYGHLILDFCYDILRLVRGDPRFRVPNLLVVAGVAAIAGPWWFPIAGELFATYFGLDRDRLTQFDNWTFWSGWVFVVTGTVLWVWRIKGSLGVDVARTLRPWRTGTRRLAERLDRQLTQLGYEPSLDVRRPTDVQPGTHVIAGEPGQGKTWSLAATAKHYSEQGVAVVWASSRIKPLDVEDHVARVVWSDGFEADSPIDLGTLARHSRQARDSATTAWLVVCIDDVSSFEDAQALCQHDWEQRGVALAISTPLEVADRLERRKLAEAHRVKDFSFIELRAFLDAHDKQHLSIADDVERLIRRPVLATVYVHTNLSPEWVPNSEYALLDAYWESIDDSTVKSTLQRLGDAALGDNGTYPWRIASLADAGVGHEEIQRAVDAGVLRHADDSRIGLWHQRLFGWTYADALARGWEAGRLTTEELSEALIACLDPRQPPHLPSVQYAAMDALWLICGKAETDQWAVVAALDQASPLGTRTEHLYREMFGTLGPRAIQAIISRVKESGEQEGNLYPTFGAVAMFNIAKSDPEAVVKAISRCLTEDHAAVLQLGLLLSKQIACPAQLDRLWSVHLGRVKADKKGGVGYHDQMLSQTAFRAAVALRPEWLDAAIVRFQDDPDALVELAYTLANTAESAAFTEQWQARKELLFEKLPADRRRSLAVCIFRFRDTPELERLEQWIGEEPDWLGTTSIKVLAFFDPQRAAKALRLLQPDQLRLIAKALGRSLLVGDTKALRNAVDDLLLQHTEDAWSLLSVYQQSGDQLNAETSVKILDRLEIDLASYDQLDRETVQNGLWRELEFIEGLHGRMFLESLRGRRGLRLESLLADFAIERANDSKVFDYQFDYAKQILKRIAGEGFTRLTNALLRANARESRFEGAEAASVRPDPTTIELLSEAAFDDELWKEPGDGFPFIQSRAVDALAAAGSNEKVIAATLKWGTRISQEVCELRAHLPPMTDVEIAPAVEAIENQNHPDRDNALIAIGLSGRTEYTERIATSFELSAPDSQHALCAMLALQDLKVGLSRVSDRLADQWASGKHKFAALKLLVAGADQWPDGYLLDRVPSGRTYDEIDERLLGFLHSQEVTRGESWRRLREHYERTNQGRDWRFLDSNVALDPHDADDFEELWRRCRVPEGHVVFGSSRAAAIARLADADAELAVRLAAKALCETSDAGAVYLDVLLRHGGEAGVRLVCESAADSRLRERCRAAGVGIRSHAKADRAAPIVHAMLKDGDWRNRRSAAMLGGFLGPLVLKDQLTDLYREDSSWHVCVEAQQALRRMQMEAEARSLVSTLGGLSPVEVWGTLDCMLRLADPDFVFMKSDPLGIQEFLDNAPFHVVLYLDKAIEKRRKKIETELTSLHGKWKDDE